MSDNTKDLTTMVFSFVSLKTKAIILGIIIGVFFIIMIPILIITSLTGGSNSEKGGRATSTGVVSQGASTSAVSEVISADKLYQYENAMFIMPFETWDPAKDVMTSGYGPRIDPITRKTIISLRDRFGS